MDTYPIEIKGMAPLLLVADLERSLAFYETYLGFKSSFFYEDFYAGLTNGVHHLHLKLNDPKVGRMHKGPEDIDLTFSVAAIGVFFEVVSAAGATITQPLREMPYGTEFYMADPDGHILAFLEEK
ncbi:MAG: ble 2 [Mucilaginibacter sp.]|nr:ble 2 [Mucilaginibacter sp.]